MKTLRDKLKGLLAQAAGVRYDAILTKAAALCTLVAGLGALAGVIPGKAGLVAAVAAGVAASLGPKLTTASGLVRQAQDQKLPLRAVLPQLIGALLSAPRLIAQEKADAQAAAQAEADAQAKRAKAVDAAQFAGAVLEALNKTGSFKQDGAGLVDDGILTDVAASVAQTGGSL